MRGGRQPNARRWSAIWLLAALILAPANAPAVSEYRLKAAFLLNFGKFVEWPGPAGVSDPLTICVLGDDPFGSNLDETLAGRTVGSRPVRARRISETASARSCAILFLSRSEAYRISALAAALKGAPVLLVGERPGFARQGGMINFIETDQKIRFEINEAAAKKAGLKISSQLLKLATIVEGR